MTDAKQNEPGYDDAFYAECRVCGHAWTDLCETGADHNNLECPECGNMTGEPMDCGNGGWGQ